MANSHNFVYINDQILKQDKALISIDQRGFLFGDGLFETCRFINRKIINFEAHLKRLKIGLSSLKFNCKIDDIEKKCYQLIEKNNLQIGIIRISISRGIGSHGYLPTFQSPNLIVIQTKDLPNLPNNRSLITSSIHSGQFPFKSANALNYVLAKIFAEENNCFDAILFDHQGYICETSSANIFWIKNGTIFTPDNQCPMVQGTIREILLNLPELKIISGKFKVDDLQNADEVFITNAIFQILPINKIIFTGLNSSCQTPPLSVSYQSAMIEQITSILTKQLNH